MRTGITRGRAARKEGDSLRPSVRNALRPGALLPRLQAKQNPFVANEKARQELGSRDVEPRARCSRNGHATFVIAYIKMRYSRHPANGAPERRSLAGRRGARPAEVVLHFRQVLFRIDADRIELGLNHGDGHGVFKEPELLELFRELERR